MIGTIPGISPTMVSRSAATVEPIPAISIKDRQINIEVNNASQELISQLIKVGSMEKVAALKEETVGQVIDLLV